MPSHMQSDPAAVLLSPPVRKTRVQKEEEMLEQMGMLVMCILQVSV